MNPEFAVEMIKALMLQGVTLAAPILLTAMVIGLAVSLFQAVTAIQEQTLAFVPKALGVIAIIVILLPWMIRNLVEFTISVIQRIPQMVH
ncbi:MAG: fliQ [Verrucomicrobiales bacterium]|jgi:flagellar biosynthetic protein FliQ|nr:fliQ [Verrucomicrobiales bacterium]